MQEKMLPMLRCPVTRSPLQLQVISMTTHMYTDKEVAVIGEAILFGDGDWCYPVIGGVPRLYAEAFLDQELFLRQHLPDFSERRQGLEQSYPGLLGYVKKKNGRTRKSFSLEWSWYNYSEDRTWEADREEMIQRFLLETGEARQDLAGKLIFDAGCGNGLLDSLLAGQGAVVVAMDLSDSILRAYGQNTDPNVLFVQGDLQFPPLEHALFDIVHSSGVLHHTNNTELSFSCLEPCVRPGGKLSIWLYHPRKDILHRLFNGVRGLTSKLPLPLLTFVLRWGFLPPTWFVKRLKGNRQNTREMMISLLDWFSPEFRREHRPDEAGSWYSKRGYTAVRVTTSDLFGFNMVGVKSAPISAPL